jgi:xylitol oxidase
MRILAGLADDLAPVLKISEVRAIAADTLWLSPCHGRQSVAFHFTWIPAWPLVQPVLERLESALASLLPRPHWVKLTTIGGLVLRSRFDHLGDFAHLLDEWDPSRKFRNAHLDALLD